MRYRDVIGLDQDGDHLYVAEMQLTREGPVLKASHHRETLPTPDTLSGYLHAFSRDSPSPVRAVAAIQRTGAVQCLLDLPPLAPEATGLAVAAALEERISFPAPDLCTGYDRAGRERPMRAVGARRSLVEERRAAIAAAGLEPARIELRPLAAAAAFWYCYGAELGDRTGVLVELRAEESSAVFVRQGEIVYSRALPGLGGNEQTALQGIAAELRSMYAILSAAPDWISPDILWLTGPLAAVEDNRNILADLLDLERAACRVARPVGLLRLATTAEPGPEMLVPIGLCLSALGVESMGPDLLPGLGHPDAKSRSLLAAAIPLGLALILILAGLRFLTGAAMKQAAVDREWLAVHEKEVTTLTALLEESAILEKRLTDLEQFGRGGSAYLDLLRALDVTLPAGTRLSRLSLSADRVETISGTTPSTSLMLRMLKNDPILARLELRGQTVRKTENGQVMETFALVGPFDTGGAAQ